MTWLKQLNNLTIVSVDVMVCHWHLNYDSYSADGVEGRGRFTFFSRFCAIFPILHLELNDCILLPIHMLVMSAIMVLPGAHDDSFPSTEPFGFSAATYFVPMTALVGVAIASMVIGKLSDIKGRKPCLLFCLYGTVVGCILKFIMRKSFYVYCAMNFLNGLVSASVPVALAYAGDVNETKREKDAEIGVLVGISMLGSSGGDILGI